MLKYYPFANNRDKQSTPSNLNTIEAYSQTSHHKKQNFHKRNASDIITSQLAQPRTSSELMRRASIFDQNFDEYLLIDDIFPNFSKAIVEVV